MIDIGTLCLVIGAGPEAKSFIGKTCTVIDHMPIDFWGHNCVIQFPDNLIIRGAFHLLLPLGGNNLKQHIEDLKPYEKTQSA